VGWSGQNSPIAVLNIQCYQSTWMDHRAADGWLELHDPEVHDDVGLITLMAANQPNKPKKVRPVMDYREQTC